MKSILTKENYIKPFIKWVGGKSQTLTEIRMKYPSELGKRINKYAEPFVGGGAVLFDILNHFDLSKVYISDINKELIFTYVTIRDNTDTLINLLKRYEERYLSANESTRKYTYYEIRDRFNVLKNYSNNEPDLAALFIFLNRTCFNGLYRVNSKGLFNVPQGSYKNPTICDEINLRNVAKKLRNIKIVCEDYKQSIDFIDNETFVYFDPPYRPISTTSSFTSYAKDGFNDSAQKELALFIDIINRKGAYVVLSNSDPKNINENDDFFDKLYSNYNISRIYASRMLNSNAKKRGKISELLICNNL